MRGGVLKFGFYLPEVMTTCMMVVRVPTTMRAIRRGWMYSHRGQVRVMVQDFTHVLVKLWWWISLMAILIVLLWLDVYMRQNDNRHNSIQLELYPIPNT